MDVFDRIELLIARNGISGAELSRELGLSNSVYSQWKSRTTKPSNKTLKKIADYFDVPVDYLLTGEETTQQKSPQPEAESPPYNTLVTELLDMLENLDDDKLDKALSYIKYLEDSK